MHIWETQTRSPPSIPAHVPYGLMFCNTVRFYFQHTRVDHKYRSMITCAAIPCDPDSTNIFPSRYILRHARYLILFLGRCSPSVSLKGLTEIMIFLNFEFSIPVAWSEMNTSRCFTHLLPKYQSLFSTVKLQIYSILNDKYHRSRIATEYVCLNRRFGLWIIHLVSEDRLHNDAFPSQLRSCTPKWCFHPRVIVGSSFAPNAERLFHWKLFLRCSVHDKAQ